MRDKQYYAIRAKNKAIIKKLCPQISTESGIYAFVRDSFDEPGIKYAYVGQAVNLLNRVLDHLEKYDHIDKSIKKRKLWSDKEPYGYKVYVLEKCHASQLNDAETRAITRLKQLGYQLPYNKTGGSQGKDKKIVIDSARKGYLQGKADGKTKATKEIATLIHKYTTGLTSKGGAVADRKTAELIELLEGTDE